MADNTLNVTVSREDRKAVAFLLGGIKNGAVRAITGSINKSLIPVRAYATKLIVQKLNLKAARVKKDFTFKRATFGDQTGAVHAEGEPIGLYQFGARELKSGISVKVEKGKGTTKLRHAFIAKGVGRQTHMNVYERQRKPGIKYGKPVMPKLKYGRLPDKYRFKLKRKTGPRIEDTYAAVFPKVEVFAVEEQQKQLDIQVEGLLRRYG